MKGFVSVSSATIALSFALPMLLSSLAQTREVQRIRCRTKLVNFGVTPFELNQKCREPD